MSGGVFICYRREESAFAARAIHDRVVQRLERENVFLDVDNIDLGVDWFNVLTERVGACDALVAVIGRNWVSSADKDDRRRIDDPDDFVRIEIEAALQRNVRVIPVLVDGAAMPKATELPESLRGLARRQGTEISPARFDADVEKLTRALGSILDERQGRDAAEAEAARRAEEERQAKETAEAERIAREEREKREAAEAAERTEQARREAEAETARRGEEELRQRKAADVERAAREERERRYAAEATEDILEIHGYGLFSRPGVIGALPAPPSPPVRTYLPIIAVGIAVGVAAALAILVATFGSPSGKFSAPAGDKVAEQTAAEKAAAEKAAADKAAVDKAAADKAVADKAAANKAAAEKAAAEKAAAEKTAADKAAADMVAADKAASDKIAADEFAAFQKAVADKAAADKAAVDKARADKAAADKAAAEKAAAEKAGISVSSLNALQELVLTPGDSFKECSVCPELIVVPAGRFTMGASDQGPDSSPPHEVTIAKPFAVAKFALTFDEWDACVAQGACRPDVSDSGWGRGRRPVINVSWNDAQAYVKWLSGVTSKPYRLLSDAEYEYTARAGSRTKYPWGDEVS